MSDNKRKYTRIEVPMPVTVTHPEFGPYELVTADICDGGVFLKASEDQCLPVGSKVTLQVKAGLLAGDEPPLVKATVVRVTADGMGLEFD